MEQVIAVPSVVLSISVLVLGAAIGDAQRSPEQGRRAWAWAEPEHARLAGVHAARVRVC